MAESGPQKASEPDPDASRHSETAEEENPAIAAFVAGGLAARRVLFSASTCCLLDLFMRSVIKLGAGLRL